MMVTLMTTLNFPARPRQVGVSVTSLAKRPESRKTFHALGGKWRRINYYCGDAARAGGRRAAGGGDANSGRSDLLPRFHMH